MGFLLAAEVRSSFVCEVGREENNSFLGRVGADFFESLESADVDAARSLSEEMGGFGDSGSGGFFAFGGNDGSATLAFGLGLLGHGAFHVGGEFDILQADAFDVDTPFVGLGVDDFADLGGDFIAFAENFVEVEVAGDVTEGGLGEGAGGIAIIRGFEDGFLGINDASIDYGVNIDGDVITSNDFLLRNVHGGSADVNFEHFVDVRDDDAEARVQGAGIAAETEDDAAFVLVDNADARNDDD